MRRALAAAAAGVVVALSFGVAPAHAAGPTVSGGTISVAMSKGNTNPPLLSGHFHVDDPASTVTVRALLTWTGPDPDHHPKFSPQAVCPGAACTSDNNGNTNFAGFALPAAAYNGPYHVDATATATNLIGQSNSEMVSTDFQVALPPPPVTNVQAAVDAKTREVFLSWDRDAATPDVEQYWIWRKGPGDKDFRPVLITPQESTGARITNVGDTGSEAKGGDYLYQIETRRNGGDGLYSFSDYVGSDRTQSQSNIVTVPNPPPGSTPPTTTPPSGGSPPVVTGTPAGPIKSSTFSGGSSSSSGSSSSFSTTPTSEAVTPDPGFVRGLPNGGSNASDQNGEGDNSAIAVTPGRHSSSSGGKGYLVPVAGAAVLGLGAMHLRIFKKRLDEPPSNLTPV